MKKNNKVDVIIPAYKAQHTILRTLASIAEQTILPDVDVTIVNDCCPNGDYHEIVEMYKPYMSIREITLKTNGGPGVARQYGIDNTENEFFTCIDADDTFCGSIALEILREGIRTEPAVKCCSGTFYQLGEDLMHIVPHQQDMVWMFGKIYRRDFIEQYKIHFNETRANEDTGFNTWVRLLCDNNNEQIRFLNECVYYWHNKTDSITRINDGQYAHDQCFCGWTDNMIYAIQNVKKVRPFSGSVSQWIVSVMLNLYYYYIETYARKNVFAKQNWEYIKKFYNTCYKRIEDDISDEIFSEMYSMASMEKWRSGSLLGIIPHIGIKEFMEQLKSEVYDPDHIYDIWEEMYKDPETRQLIKNNETCGVCPVGYTKRPQDRVKVTPKSEEEDTEDEEEEEKVISHSSFPKKKKKKNNQ